MRSPISPTDRKLVRLARKSVRKSVPKAKGRKLEFFETGAAAVQALRSRVKIGGLVYEPCNGLGAISRAFQDCLVITNDVDPEKPADSHVDAARYVYEEPGTVVTNPPFSEGFEILLNARAQGRPCAFLLRLSFVEPTQGRMGWLHENPPDGMIVLPRYSYTGDGRSDSVTCAWFLWGLKVEPAIQIAAEDEPDPNADLSEAIAAFAALRRGR